MKILLIILIPLVLFCVSCNKKRICCSPGPSYLEFIVGKNTEKAQNFIKEGKVNKTDVYLYRMKNGMQVKITTHISEYETDIHIVSTGKSLYDSNINDGLTTIYLHQLNNQNDTIQLEIIQNKKLQHGYSINFNKVIINGKLGVHSSGNSFYLDPPPYLRLYAEKNNETTKGFIRSDETADRNVYFYLIDHGKRVVLPLDYNHSNSHFFVYSRLSDVYKHTTNTSTKQRLNTIYLRKLDNQTDTIQLNVTKKDVNGYPRYALSQVNVNGKPGVPFPTCGDKQYCYYLKPPSGRKK